MNKIVNGIVIALTDAEITEFNASKPTDAEILAQKWEGVRNQRNQKQTIEVSEMPEQIC